MSSGMTTLSSKYTLGCFQGFYNGFFLCVWMDRVSSNAQFWIISYITIIRVQPMLVGSFFFFWLEGEGDTSKQISCLSINQAAIRSLSWQPGVFSCSTSSIRQMIKWAMLKANYFSEGQKLIATSFGGNREEWGWIIKTKLCPYIGIVILNIWNKSQNLFWLCD